MSYITRLYNALKEEFPREFALEYDEKAKSLIVREKEEEKSSG